MLLLRASESGKVAVFDQAVRSLPSQILTVLSPHVIALAVDVVGRPETLIRHMTVSVVGGGSSEGYLDVTTASEPLRLRLDHLPRPEEPVDAGDTVIASYYVVEDVGAYVTELSLAPGTVIAVAKNIPAPVPVDAKLAFLHTTALMIDMAEDANAAIQLFSSDPHPQAVAENLISIAQRVRGESLTSGDLESLLANPAVGRYPILGLEVSRIALTADSETLASVAPELAAVVVAAVTATDPETAVSLELSKLRGGAGAEPFVAAVEDRLPEQSVEQKIRLIAKVIGPVNPDRAGYLLAETAQHEFDAGEENQTAYAAALRAFMGLKGMSNGGLGKAFRLFKYSATREAAASELLSVYAHFRRQTSGAFMAAAARGSRDGLQAAIREYRRVKLDKPTELRDLLPALAPAAGDATLRADLADALRENSTPLIEQIGLIALGDRRAAETMAAAVGLRGSIVQRLLQHAGRASSKSDAVLEHRLALLVPWRSTGRKDLEKASEMFSSLLDRTASLSRLLLITEAAADLFNGRRIPGINVLRGAVVSALERVPATAPSEEDEMRLASVLAELKIQTKKTDRRLRAARERLGPSSVS
jgi:hypothetical protein